MCVFVFACVYPYVKTYRETVCVCVFVRPRDIRDMGRLCVSMCVCVFGLSRHIGKLCVFVFVYLYAQDLARLCVCVCVCVYAFASKHILRKTWCICLRARARACMLKTSRGTVCVRA